MEGIHGVDVSWLHHTPKGKHLAAVFLDVGAELGAIAIPRLYVVRSLWSLLTALAHRPLRK